MIPTHKVLIFLFIEAFSCTSKEISFPIEIFKQQKLEYIVDSCKLFEYRERKLCSKVICDSSLNQLTKLDKNDFFVCDFDNKSSIESFKFIGSMLINDTVYRAYYFFKKIMLANGYRGFSYILFTNQVHYYSYASDFIDEPIELKYGILHIGNNSVKIDSFGKYLPIPDNDLVRYSNVYSDYVKFSTNYIRR